MSEMIPRPYHTKRKQRSSRRKKRATPYNRSLSTTTDADESIVDIHSEVPTVSHSKIINIEHRTETENDELTGKRIDIGILSSVFAIVSCPECSCIGLRLTQKKNRGMAFGKCISCNAGCGWENELWTSPNKSKSRNYKVNGRMFTPCAGLAKVTEERNDY